MPAGEIITQVSNTLDDAAILSETLPDVIHLEMRGKRFRIERENLLELPENVLLSLSGSPFYADQTSAALSTESGQEVIHVDFNPECFVYILDHFNAVLLHLNPPTMPLSNFEDSAALYDNLDQDQVSNNEQHLTFQPNVIPDILQHRPAIVVLREDIEYFCLDGDANASHATMAILRRDCGNMIAAKNSIFDGLHDGDVPDTPEYFLKQMLCLAGFAENETWGYRQRESHRAQVLSVHLLDLKMPTQDDLEKIQAVQKLLLFWKKPARKCWWDKFTLQAGGKDVTVHLRRAWTFELSILGIVNA
ncbi:WHI2-like protein P4H10.16c [Wickerhamiella sorbophila]|uniref:WHI2-like protein P4H10.16c n=1 Tax=Wickerhamiella sorbophila TaxID=45607 RepID=A0A2T0FD85_9ASCO|nr:WHI2-like protein P4H10.16c [Wickerhamiella sorbophila]PRT52962.1 WHI2-like protein P4H10.16c [Wickerhamiella sorbophila]